MNNACARAIESDRQLLELAFKHIRQAVNDGRMTVEDGCRRSVDTFFIHDRNVRLIRALFAEGRETA